VILDVNLNDSILEQPSHDSHLPFMRRSPQSVEPLIVNAVAARPTGLQDGVDHLQVPVAGGQRQCRFLLVGLRANVQSLPQASSRTATTCRLQ
jgi:hypothetical protein